MTLYGSENVESGTQCIGMDESKDTSDMQRLWPNEFLDCLSLLR